ncbi:MAG: type II secretion system secretin GspD [Deltaproteobacteria bacterium]|nr:type II secretion system secretin GspD [Deltaproteobacteria bacterium]
MRLLFAVLLLAPAMALAQAPSRSPVPGTPSVPLSPRSPGRVAPAVPPPGQVAPAPAPAGVPGAPPPGTPGAPPSAPRPGVSSAESVPTGGEGRCQPLQGKFLLAFNKADIVDVLEQASRWTCRNFAYTEDIARGKITLLSKAPVTAEEAYAAFLSALTANNIAIFQSGRYWRLTRIADAKKTPIPVISPDGEPPAQEQPVTRLIRLRHADPDMLRGLLGNYTSPQGADIQSVPPDLLIITDIGLNLLRIEKLLETIDRPGGGDLVRFIQVKHAPARDLAEKINQIFQSSPGSPGKPARRPIIGGVGGAPGQPAPAPSAEGPTELSISKVLADERTNKLVVIADEKSFQRIQELVAQLDQPTAGEGQIHVVYMKNANAEDLAQTLSSLASGQSSTRRPGGVPGNIPPQPGAQPAGAAGATSAALFSGDVKVTADKVSNSLIIMASGSDFATMQRLIDKLDRPRRQVFVEAVILEVNLNNENQFGVSMHGVVPVNTPSGKGYLPLASETGRINSFNPASLLSLGGFLTGLSGPASAELKDLLPGVSSFTVLLQALQTSSDVNVISTPHLLASDNEDAEITVGQNVPFQAAVAQPGIQNLLSQATTTGANSAATAGLASGLLSGGLTSGLFAPIQRQNVELRLKVKPQINEGDTVTLQLDEQTEEIASKDPQLGPTTAKRSVKTKITVKDQSTIVIGGLIQDRVVTGVRKTPLLGDIPVLGWLFRDQTATKTKTNLLLFLTPYIIRDQSDYRRILERKRKEQQEFIREFYGDQPEYRVNVDYERKPGPYSRMHRDVENEALKLENGGPGAPGEGVVGPDGRRGAAPAPAPAPASAPPTGPTPAPATGSPPATPRWGIPIPRRDPARTPMPAPAPAPQIPAPVAPQAPEGASPADAPAPAPAPASGEPAR